MYIKTREELLGTVIDEVPYGWMVVPARQLLKDTDLFVSGGWGGRPRGHLVAADLQKCSKSFISGFVFGCSYIRPIEDETTEIKQKFYYVVDPDNNKVVGIVDDSVVVHYEDGYVLLEITSKDRISKIQELFKI